MMRIDEFQVATQLKFGIEEWERVVKSGGDLSVLGIDVIPDKPIENFDKAWPARPVPTSCTPSPNGAK